MRCADYYVIRKDMARLFYTIYAVTGDTQVEVPELEIPYARRGTTSMDKRLYQVLTQERPESSIAARTSILLQGSRIHSTEKIDDDCLAWIVREFGKCANWHYSPFVPEAAEPGSWCVQKNDPEDRFSIERVYYRCLCSKLMEIDIEELVMDNCDVGPFAHPLACICCEACHRHVWPSFVAGPAGLLPPCRGDQYRNDYRDYDDEANLDDYEPDPKPEGETA